jgi:hypothetical protein
MTEQETSAEPIIVAEQYKDEVAKKYGYKNWEDAYKFNGGDSFKKMLDDVMVLCLSQEEQIKS